MPHRRRNKGFTLIELVVGIVVIAIALTLLSNVFFNSASRSVEPMLQIRAAEFGQALMDEILSKKFDHMTPEGGVPACNLNCTDEGDLGPEGTETRPDYNDVDDYTISCGAPIAVTDALGNQPVGFERYTMEVCVNYDNFDGNGVENANAKLIRVFINRPGFTSPMVFSAYKGNY
ncbi:type II secretion system protein [Oceanicoccus sagamiensis]|uniref:MSHA biogenesis protein MshD n=1 Tax=Oceanicoccus sagamiensis TaxID=716816 RepID=A0A1X9N7C0_9GAMM|nr:type II secretion system protein [Oceanicoccus sagamiensis]ARN73586.1 hypothetical protein BST96_05300 [Oceanicoccus sagamiensis]